VPLPQVLEQAEYGPHCENWQSTGHEEDVHLPNVIVSTSLAVPLRKEATIELPRPHDMYLVGEIQRTYDPTDI
jgi:hypothetical protein